VVTISVRTPGGFVNQLYEGAAGRHFEAKLFQLTGTPQGGSTPDILSTRFSLALPAHYARKHGLKPTDEEPYSVDVRVQYVRTHDGYAFTCRLLDQQKSPKLHQLGFSHSLLRAIKRSVQEPSGLILVSGPTGSGKTTLLNAVLGHLNTGQRSIVTIENPVEFNIKGLGPIKQIQVGGDITFARALRAALRLDPDLILIGEIRDEKTMEIALQAAQTGHLVLATIHANSAAETISRALDLTIDKRRDSYRLAETLKFVMAQRLLDRFDGGQELRPLVQDEIDWFEVNGIWPPAQIAEATSGKHTGKTALVEAIVIDDGIKKAIRSELMSIDEIYQLACDQPQYETLASAGVRAVESEGCRLRDCMTRLESTTAAQAFPGLRSRLAKECGMSLFEVAQRLDAFSVQQEAGGARTMASYFEWSLL
jgi:type II secretory ATPase GspE/PulE/Tfp pilus assembly ATPase PilB-like protein